MKGSLSRELDRVEKASRKLRAAQRDRDEAIRDAARVESFRRIAEAAGLSHGRVHQIVHGK